MLEKHKYLGDIRVSYQLHTTQVSQYQHYKPPPQLKHHIILELPSAPPLNSHDQILMALSTWATGRSVGQTLVGANTMQVGVTDNG